MHEAEFSPHNWRACAKMILFGAQKILQRKRIGFFRLVRTERLSERFRNNHESGWQGGRLGKNSRRAVWVQDCKLGRVALFSLQPTRDEARAGLSISIRFRSSCALFWLGRALWRFLTPEAAAASFGGCPSGPTESAFLGLVSSYVTPAQRLMDFATLVRDQGVEGSNPLAPTIFDTGPSASLGISPALTPANRLKFKSPGPHHS